MPTFIKTGFWDKKAKAPDGWLDLNLFVETLIPPTPPPTPSTNIYNSDGTLTGTRTLNGSDKPLIFQNVRSFDVNTQSGGNTKATNSMFGIGNAAFNSVIVSDFPANIEAGFVAVVDNSINPLFNNKTLFIGKGNLTAYQFTFGLIVDLKNDIIKTKYQNNDIGLKLDFANNDYTLGNNNYGYFLKVTDNSIITRPYNGNAIGISLDKQNRVYELGQITGNNATTLRIDDAAAFPVQVSGTNVTQNTSGTASGKFLKIKVDGVDYVIELKNPS